jgi:hypothetical protein
MKTFKIIFFSILFVYLTIDSYGQNQWIVEAKIGSGNTEINTLGKYPDLSLGTSNELFLSFGILKKLKNNFNIGLETDLYGFDLGFTFLPLETEHKGGIKTKFWSIGPKIQKDIYIIPKLGLSVATGLHLTHTTADEYTYTGIWQAIRLPNGDQRIPILFYGNREVQKTTFHIKPEVGVFFDISDNSRITMTGKWGLDLREPSIVIDLDRIEYEDQTFQNRYSFSGNYFSALLGYQYSF